MRLPTVRTPLFSLFASVSSHCLHCIAPHQGRHANTHIDSLIAGPSCPCPLSPSCLIPCIARLSAVEVLPCRSLDVVQSSISVSKPQCLSTLLRDSWLETPYARSRVHVCILLYMGMAVHSAVLSCPTRTSSTSSGLLTLQRLTHTCQGCSDVRVMQIYAAASDCC